MKFNTGDKVYVLYDYGLEEAIVVSAKGTKTILVEHEEGNYRQRAKIEKVCRPDDRIAVVWEMWKGVNGRGGYRIEYNLYDDKRVLASVWPWKEYIWEKEYGKLHTQKPPYYQ